MMRPVTPGQVERLDNGRHVVKRAFETEAPSLQEHNETNKWLVAQS